VKRNSGLKTMKSLGNITWKSLGKVPLLHRKMVTGADRSDLVGSPLRILRRLRLILGELLLLGPGQQEPNGNRR
jgi:hypothetical protein